MLEFLIIFGGLKIVKECKGIILVCIGTKPKQLPSGCVVFAWSGTPGEGMYSFDIVITAVLDEQPAWSCNPGGIKVVVGELYCVACRSTR